MVDQSGKIVDVNFLGADAPITILCFEEAVRAARKDENDPKYLDCFEIVSSKDHRDLICGLKGEEAYDITVLSSPTQDFNAISQSICQQLLEAGTLVVDNKDRKTFAVSSNEAGVLQFESLN